MPSVTGTWLSFKHIIFFINVCQHKAITDNGGKNQVYREDFIETISLNVACGK